MTEEQGETLSPLRDEHFRAFGAIIHVYARFEYLFVGMIGELTGAGLHGAALITAGLSYSAKFDALKAILKESPREDAVAEKLNDYLSEIGRHGKLRNQIAQCGVDIRPPRSISQAIRRVRQEWNREVLWGG